MFKFFISIVVVASASFCAQDDSYIFEAKGKFAKELKQLVEKYSKDGKIDVKVIKPSKNKNIISTLIGRDNNADLSVGKKIYDTNCYKCHGIKAQKSSYANARVLSTMSKQEIVDETYNYKRDLNYGGSTRYVMYNAVDSLNEKDIKSIAEYIVNINKENIKSNINKSTRSLNTNGSNEEKSSYLK